MEKQTDDSPSNTTKAVDTTTEGGPDSANAHKLVGIFFF